MSNHSVNEEEVVHSDDASVQSKGRDSEAENASHDGHEKRSMRGTAAATAPTINGNQDSNNSAPSNPPLPNEIAPPLPEAEDDGWDPIWDPTAQAYYFYNRFTQASQWTNPRVPDAEPKAPGVGKSDGVVAAPVTASSSTDQPPLHGGYNPTIHGDYDPNASYATASNRDPSSTELPSASTGPEIYSATGVFNRFTGKWQPHEINPENHNDENKSRRQMSAFFDVDAAANSHDGKSLKAERSGKKLSKAEVKAFKEKRKERKEERRRAWLRD